LRDDEASLTGNGPAYVSGYEEKKQVVKWWGTKSGKPQKSSKIKGFGTRYCGSTASRLHVVLRSSASVNSNSHRKKLRDRKVPEFFLYPGVFLTTGKESGTKRRGKNNYVWQKPVACNYDETGI
ncbi:MAG: hypothetical protein II510_02200, partial [Erysipelotrichales bacterium]|nr:hypothetical protein [Erysipelotrichales bacterium]